MRRLAVAVASTATASILALIPAGVASAAGPENYYGQIASALHQQPVFVDPAGVSPHGAITKAQAQQLGDQIRATGKPIYIVVVNNAKARNVAATAKQFATGLHYALGDTSQVIGISTARGFYGYGFNVPVTIASRAHSLAPQAVNDFQRYGAYTVYSKWVTAVSSLTSQSSSNSPSASSGVGNSTAAPADHGLPGWAVFLIVLGGIVSIGGIVVFVWLRRRNKRDQDSENQTRARIQRGLDELADELLTMNIDAELHPEANTEYTNAMLVRGSAQTALDQDDLDDAATKLATARKHYNDAQTLISGRSPSGTTARTSYADESSSPAATRTSSPSAFRPTGRTPQPGGNTTGARLRNPDSGNTITINNTSYVSQPSQGGAYQYYYGGGDVGGVYYVGGWYRDPFWKWDVLEAGMVLSAIELGSVYRQDTAYDQGFLAGEQAANTADAYNPGSGNWDGSSDFSDPTADASGDGSWSDSTADGQWNDGTPADTDDGSWDDGNSRDGGGRADSGWNLSSNDTGGFGADPYSSGGADSPGGWDSSGSSDAGGGDFGGGGDF